MIDRRRDSSTTLGLLASILRATQPNEASQVVPEHLEGRSRLAAGLALHVRRGSERQAGLINHERIAKTSVAPGNAPRCAMQVASPGNRETPRGPRAIESSKKYPNRASNVSWGESRTARGTRSSTGVPRIFSVLIEADQRKKFRACPGACRWACPEILGASPEILGASPGASPRRSSSRVPRMEFRGDIK